MGITNHNVIIATTFDDDVFDGAKEWVRSYLTVVQGQFKWATSPINSFHTVILTPDGSKEGWTSSKVGDQLRASFIEHLDASDEDDDGTPYSPWDWVEIGYGEYGMAILDGNCTNKYDDRPYANPLDIKIIRMGAEPLLNLPEIVTAEHLAIATDSIRQRIAASHFVRPTDHPWRGALTAIATARLWMEAEAATGVKPEMIATQQSRLARWHRAAWPKMYPQGQADDVRLAAKLAEEAGEVAGATIKIEEGRRTLQDLAGEMGDVLVCLSVLAERHGWTLQELFDEKATDILGQHEK